MHNIFFSASVICILLCMLSCLNPNGRESLINNAADKKHGTKIELMSLNKDSIFYQDTSISLANYKLRVRTCMQNDRVASTDSNFFNPIVLKQEIFFFKQNKLISKINYPANKIKLQITSGKSVEMLENVLYNIGVIDIGNDVLFILKGTGGCNSCSEFFAIYSDFGKPMVISYSKGHTIYKSIGSIDEVLHKYKLVDQSVFDSKTKNVDVYFNKLIYGTN